MTLPITIPSAPSVSNSPSSEESIPARTSPSPTMSNPDQTTQVLPVNQSSSPSFQEQQQDQSNTNNATSAANNAGNNKRKPSRRANTAERRATHNAVERQRRETLNGRFLDLAALLPNLSQVRRPSKSSIVNSSIAHIHASRRHRLLAARELRLVKLESDALRREVNEWRNRAGIPILEEPVRSEAFSMVISGELEVITGVQAEEEDDEMAFGGYDGEDDGYPVAPQTSAAGLDGLADPRVAILKNFPHGVPAQQAHYHSGNGLHLTHVMSRSAAQTAGPMIASPTAVAFENPALPAMYDSHPYQGVPFLHSASVQSLESEKITAWNAAQLYHSHTNSRSMFTSPPVSSHSMSSGSPGHSSTSGSVSPGPHTSSSPPVSTTHFNDTDFFNIARPQQQIIGQHPYGSPPERDDASSVSSNRSHGDRDREQQYRQKTSIVPAVSSVRERSRSLSSQAYELESGPHGEYSINLHARRATHGGAWARDADIAMAGMNVGMGIGGMNPVAVGGGGGNGNGFAMMMM